MTVPEVDRYQIEEAEPDGEGELSRQMLLCPWTLSRDGREIAHFTTRDRAIDYRDWLIERNQCT